MDGGGHPGGRIGPNAITRMAEALPADAVDALFAEAGLAAYRRAPPSGMVAEREVAALVATSDAGSTVETHISTLRTDPWDFLVGATPFRGTGGTS